jgi:hypothetical protein
MQENFAFLNLNIPLFKEGVSIEDISKQPIDRLNQKIHLNKDLLTFFDSLNLIVLLVETFFKRPGNTDHIHIDNSGGDYVKLNWVFGGGDSRMCWYKPIDSLNKTVLRTTIGTPYVSYLPDEVIEIESVVVSNPTLVQVGIPHDVQDVTEDRLCVSILFLNKKTGKRLTMADARELFQQYLRN